MTDDYLNLEMAMGMGHWTALKTVVEYIDESDNSSEQLTSVILFMLSAVKSLDMSAFSEALQDAFLVHESLVLTGREKLNFGDAANE